MCARARAVFARGGFGGASRRRYIAAPRGNTGRLLIERAALLAHFRRAARETSVARAARAGLTRYLGLGCGVLGASFWRARFVCIHNTTTAAVVRKEKSSGPTVARVARRTCLSNSVLRSAPWSCARRGGARPLPSPSRVLWRAPTRAVDLDRVFCYREGCSNV